MAEAGKKAIDIGSSEEETVDNEDDEPEFPNTLEGFGFKFDSAGFMKNITTGEPFIFDVKPHDHVYNQKRYDALGEVLTEYTNNYMESTDMDKLVLPLDAAPDEPVTCVYHNKDCFSRDCLVLIIHGSDGIRAGQWSRRLIINDGFRSGSQITFIKRGIGLGFGVILLNPNDNYIEKDGVVQKIRGSETPEKHANYVWKKVVMELCTEVEHVGIIAHGYGGIVAVNMFKSFPAEFHDKVYGFAFTDSAHSLTAQNVPINEIKWIRKISRHWVTSAKKLDTPLVLNNPLEVPLYSAGTQKHDLTNWSAFNSIYTFLDGRLQRKVLSLLDITFGQRGPP